MKKERLHIKYKKGFSLVEILIAVSVFLVFVTVTVNIIVNTSKQVKNSDNKERATALAEESLEALRNLRDADFINLSDGTYGINVVGNQWNLIAPPDVTDIFSRTLNISTINPNQKLIETEVSWSDEVSSSNTVALDTYLTNWKAMLNIGPGLTVNKTIINHGKTKVAVDFEPYEVTSTLPDSEPFVVNLGVANLFSDGSYVVSETPDPDYDQTFSGDCNSSGLVSMVANSAKVCTITNEEKLSYLIIHKTVINHGGTKVSADFAPYQIDGNTVLLNASNNVNSGAHVVSELTDPNYSVTFGGDCDLVGNVTLGSGETKTCEITNEEILQASITVNKVVINNGGTKVATDFGPFLVGATPVTLGVASVIPEGTYIVSENADPSYTLTFSGDCDANGSVTLVAGVPKTCTLTNTERSWATPSQQSSYNAFGTQDGLKVQVQGSYAYVIRNDGTPDFLIIDISNPATPTLTGSLNLTGVSTNIFVSGNYAYVSSQDDAQELQIIDISIPAVPTVAGTFDHVGSTANARGIYVVGTTAYLTKESSAQNEFVIINVSSPAVPTLVGSLDLAATGYEVYVSGNSAFVASGSNTQELQVINITNPATPSIIGSYNPSANTDATAISGFGSYVFLARSSSIYVLNISTPASPVLTSTFSAGGSVNDIALNLGNAGKYVFFTTANSNREFEVFSIAIPATPVSVGVLNLTAYNGIAYDPIRDRAVLVGPNDPELVVIRPLE